MKLTRLIAAASLAGAFFPGSPAIASTLSEAALYNRCYIHLTGRPVPRDSAVLRQVRAGQVTALAACGALLDATSLDASTGMMSTAASAESYFVLNNFYTFHRSWFSSTAVEQIQGYGEENSPATRDLYDATEPSLAVTRAVFASGAKYSDVVTLPTGVTALRQDDSAIRQWAVSIPSRSLVGNNGNVDRNLIDFRELNDGDPSHGYVRNSNATRSQVIVMDKIQTGELRGIAPTTKQQMVPNVSLSLLNQVPDLRGSDQPGFISRFDKNHSFGGGVLGTPIFLMLNFGHGVGLTMNGSTKVPRRWAKTVMNTFMCAPLPNLRASDVEQYLAPGSTAPFRNAVSCLQCHSSLDPMAYTARNIVIANSDVYPTNEGNDPVKVLARTSMMVGSFKSDVGTSTTGWPAEPVKNFHRQPTTGRLYMRLVSGQLLDRPLASIADLGTAVSSTDDYYQCAAKRYFEFMTGISAALYDRTNPVNEGLNQALTKEAAADRRFVEDLAKNFRSSQSVKALLKDIMASDYYRSPNFRP